MVKLEPRSNQELKKDVPKFERGLDTAQITNFFPLLYDVSALKDALSSDFEFSPAERFEFVKESVSLRNENPPQSFDIQSNGRYVGNTQPRIQNMIVAFRAAREMGEDLHVLYSAEGTPSKTHLVTGKVTSINIDGANSSTIIADQTIPLKDVFGIRLKSEVTELTPSITFIKG